MVLQTNFKAFKVVSSIKFFFEDWKFFDFFCISGVTYFLIMTNFFFERYRPEICRSLHKWCCERILRRFKLFRGKKIFFWKFTFFWLFLHIRGHRFLEKWPTSFLRDTGLKFVVDCTNGATNEFKGVLGCFERKIFFLRIGNFFTFFAYPWSQISWKMANYFLEKYRPEICRGLHKWCYERILRRFRLFRAKKIFFENWQFFYFFCISGATDFLKNG